MADDAPNGFDALLPAAMVERAVAVGVAKAALPLRRLVVLGGLGGAFISLGAMFSTVVTAGPTNGGSLPGTVKLAGGVAFALGLILVVVGGAELFTGNNLLTIAYAERRVSARALLRNWAVVYAANVVGAVGTALLVFATDQYRSSKGAVGLRMVEIAEAKAAGGVRATFASAIVANILVCLAVWLTYSCRSVIDKMAVIVLPVAAFVAGGFDHSIANLYLLPTGWLVRAHGAATFWASVERQPAAFGHLHLGPIAANIATATAGNVVGGALAVGVVYWWAYGRTP